MLSLGYRRSRLLGHTVNVLCLILVTDLKKKSRQIKTTDKIILKNKKPRANNFSMIKLKIFLQNQSIAFTGSGHHQSMKLYTHKK